MSGLCKGAEVRLCETVQGFNNSEAEAGILAFAFPLTICSLLRNNSCFKFSPTEIFEEQIFCRYSNVKSFSIIRFGHPLITKTLNMVFHLNVQMDFSYFFCLEKASRMIGIPCRG